MDPNTWSADLFQLASQWQEKGLLTRYNVFMAISITVTALYLIHKGISRARSFRAPLVGRRFSWEPKWLIGLRFSQYGLEHLMEGCKRFNDGIFKVARNDTDILVIPNRYVDELHSKPEEHISAIKAHMKNLLGKYSTIDILQEGNLHTHVLQTKLTPNLGSLMSTIEEELRFAMTEEIPSTHEDWKDVSIYDIILHLVARISARVFVGQPTCRNQEWLDTSIRFTEHAFLTLAILRRLPKFLHPIVAPLLPSYWAVHRDLQTAKRIISPIVKQRTADEASGEPGYKKPTDLLQWMIDVASPRDGQPDKLAHRQLVLSLAAIHTTTMAVAYAIYDLCQFPEYVEPLRQEITDSLEQDGKWAKTTLTKMHKLDSFIKESQRLSPLVYVLSFQRIVMQEVTLSDGTALPKGTHISVPAAEVLQGKAFDSSFDGFRYSRRRQNSGEAHKYQFATTDKNSLHFGHGKYACPGRFFAAYEIKMIISHLLMDYDFRFPPGTSRPKVFSADEVLLPDPSTRVLMHRRTDSAHSNCH
ncbi:uncharacterized protein N7446_007811 [Penicillium canescens]|uniref:uncharacterized protein n=1 Tax=Penicillium canescens TaxID=5083 RepID=UPI0026E08346|nr:uncharacterized protein N7446_007811 [Penicillium canescens]KAJ6058228.1 hypothetical protein N7446_007811 [Penicillium canescens]